MTAALLLIPVATAALALRVSFTGEPTADAVSRGRDALWLGHAWVDGRRDAADLAALERRMAGTGIRELYVHAGPLEHDGTLPASAYPRAKWLISTLHRDLPRIRVHAWLGDRLAYGGGENESEEDGLRLDRASARDEIVTSARQVLTAGFAGVHFDLEPLHSGNRDYLALLDRLRPAIHARGGVLSVATHKIDPLPALHTAAGALTGRPKWWSQRYFGAVARRVDQVAVMSYDTALPVESLYGGYVAQQTALALEATPAGTDLLMGPPFYHTDDFGHRSSAETVAAAVRGARLGLTRTDRHREHFGMALYVDFAATDLDWAEYRRGWCAPSGL
ncbi:hypothetical protein [Streptomyces sp. H27-D2]|uniref:hypothetical protein n=1 Tax=Streptomyces sp. H27-D2 TaxID=3046304 RepID=UPI003FA6A5E3